MGTTIFSADVIKAISDAQAAASQPLQRMVTVDGEQKSIPYPFPSPTDWRDSWIYFLMVDRFNNPDNPPNGQWDRIFDFRQGGTFKGIQQQLSYIEALGAKALWLSPVLKNARPESQWGYHGYAIQDFLSVDERFGSDGTSATAEQELVELIQEAHGRGIYIIFDIVINHTAKVFEYLYHGQIKKEFQDSGILNAIIGGEPPIRWVNGFGAPRMDWYETIPAGTPLSPDDAVWPAELQRADFFRRRGTKISDAASGPEGFAKGDFGEMRQLSVEYLSGQFPFQQGDIEKFGYYPVLSILALIYQYLIAKFDIDGYRIDTVKYVHPRMVQTFGNAIREFAISIGKRNFFTFGEIYDDEKTIAQFVGRNSTDTEGYGIDAALDFPLFYVLPKVAKASEGVESVRQVFTRRKEYEEGLLSSHGEAGKYFVSFLDNHDQNERFNHPLSPKGQILLGVAALFCLQGIPCLYYGTEQGLHGTTNLGTMESVREALWGKTPVAFDPANDYFSHIRQLSALRQANPALRFGRLYFREVSGNGIDFGLPVGVGGILAFSRILSNKEVLFVANTNPLHAFSGQMVIDAGLNRNTSHFTIAYSSTGSAGQQEVRKLSQVNFYEAGTIKRKVSTTVISVSLAPMEVQILHV